MIRFWAFIYRLTGWYSNSARAAEYEHILDYIESGELARFMAECGAEASCHISLRMVIGIEIGLWQADKGFLTVWRDPRKPYYIHTKQYFTNLFRY